ncbi:helix-turn-helix transcriptional regulator [Nocardia cyriacigeorgica]|uniref:helix-turn-helix domain-containing protein n=1 Tax=Nocardia cyriacigeorgica TaxID=135487 RepID=UPI001895534F|nr:helix-turn-helix transcriptional regulator [Nocardia cyriacigeorgica]MBF6096737.1 helix-turn-helix transcriptional regulator [Nocardia cyriacigeorgica]MBF6513940.1 helix-turn-helix transcriptional regulator [Nocardia cyriacigeorgica]
MPDNTEIGAVLRDLRKSRHLTLAVVAHRAGCAESLVSYIESGRRRLHPWLATKLDEIYRTGGVIAALIRDQKPPVSRRPDEVSQRDTLVVELPEGGASMPLSRRELLASLGVGITTGPLLSKFEAAIENVSIGDNTLLIFEDAYTGYQTAARSLRPSRLIDGLTGSVAILDGLRRRATGSRHNELLRMQARYAESLSWISEEAGDLASAMYWIDRASQWGLAANWGEVSAYCFVRRSMMAISFASDGRRAVDSASAVLHMSGASPRIQGLAAKQAAFGYALTGDEEASNRALDRAMEMLTKPAREEDAPLGQRSVVDDDLFAIFRTTCDIYLGRGQRVVPVLQPRLASLSASSLRTATITRAKLARAYANAGQPDEAVQLSLSALDDIDRIGSLSARSELRRALPNLARWHGRDDVQNVIRRLSPTA